MTEHNLQDLSQKLDELIRHCSQLHEDNQSLLKREQQWLNERAHLIEKNELVRKRVESMIQHLKSLKEGVN
ncbi:TIGR02449 family protein [Candidatus Endobugula sertula]|uniref:TIGR02449 family protein n=1 Tax=Candidatus Endobugula sertula TaxID=62101 RepID=A0A1D2QR15_9GAMM|nr:TIGR02449 family protein [Candidatus Endobugula sertula]